MRTMLLGLALLIAGASSPAAETLLDTVLYAVSGLEAQDVNKRKVIVVQDAASLDAKLLLWSISPGSPGQLKHVASIALKRLTNCRFEVSFANSGFNSAAKYSVDFSGADLAGTYLTATPNAPLSHSAVIPGATWCHLSGRPHFKLGEPSCSGASAVLPGFPARDDDKMLAAIHRLETFCKPKVSLLGELAR